MINQFSAGVILSFITKVKSKIFLENYWVKNLIQSRKTKYGVPALPILKPDKAGFKIGNNNGLYYRKIIAPQR